MSLATWPFDRCDRRAVKRNKGREVLDRQPAQYVNVRNMATHFSVLVQSGFSWEGERCVSLGCLCCKLRPQLARPSFLLTTNWHAPRSALFPPLHRVPTQSPLQVSELPQTTLYLKNVGKTLQNGRSSWVKTASSSNCYLMRTNCSGENTP